MSCFYKIMWLAPLFVIAALIGCKGTAFPACKNDSQCAAASGVKGVCVLGQCQECADDMHCSDQKKCVYNRCEKTCSADNECGNNTYCAEGVCKSDCDSVRSCSNDQKCSMGRCMAASSACGEAGDCQPGFACESGICTRRDSTAAFSSGECLSHNIIHFDFNQAKISENDMPTLEKTAKCLQKYPTLKIRSEGHADERGSTEFNMSLGQKRAQAVADYIAHFDIGMKRAKVMSYGKEKPLDSAKSEEAYKKNRRAEITLEEK